MSEMPHTDRRYVTHDEFSNFRDLVGAEFRDIKVLLRDLQSNQKFPMTIGLTAIGMAAAAVIFITTSLTAPVQKTVSNHNAQLLEIQRNRFTAAQGREARDMIIENRRDLWWIKQLEIPGYGDSIQNKDNPQ